MTSSKSRKTNGAPGRSCLLGALELVMGVSQDPTRFPLPIPSRRGRADPRVRLRSVQRASAGSSRFRSGVPAVPDVVEHVGQGRSSRRQNDLDPQAQDAQESKHSPEREVDRLCPLQSRERAHWKSCALRQLLLRQARLRSRLAYEAGHVGHCVEPDGRHLRGHPRAGSKPRFAETFLTILTIPQTCNPYSSRQSMQPVESGQGCRRNEYLDWLLGIDVDM